jgi:outer membrane protein assembly factor BamB
MSSARPPFRTARGPALALAVAGLGCAHAAVPETGAATRTEPAAAPQRAADEGRLGPPGEGPVDDADRARGLLWRFHAGAPLAGGAAVGNGQVYVGSTEGYLHALDAEGAFRWSYTVKGGIVGSPVVDPGGRIYVATTAREINAIQPDGTRWWTFRSPAAIVTPLVQMRDGSLVFGGGDRHLWAVSSRAGARWRAPIAGRIGVGPVLGAAADRVAVVTAAGGLAVISGAWARWDAELGAAPGAAPVVGADGTVHVVAAGTLVAFGVKGQRLWERPGVDFVARGAGGELVAFGAEQWTTLDAHGRPGRSGAFDGYPSAVPLAHRGHLFVPCDDGVLRILAPEGVIRRLAVAPAPLHAPRQLGDRVVVTGGDGTVVALDAHRIVSGP